MVIWKREAGDFIVKVRRIVFVLEAGHKVEYPIMVCTVSRMQEVAYFIPIITIQRRYAARRPAAYQYPVSNIAEVELYAVLGRKPALLARDDTSDLVERHGVS